MGGILSLRYGETEGIPSLPRLYRVMRDGRHSVFTASLRRLYGVFTASLRRLYLIMHHSRQLPRSCYLCPMHDFLHQDTIVALATPPGSSAIGLLRISGTAAFDLAGSFFLPLGAESPKIPNKPRKAQFGRWMDGAEALDEVLLTIFPAPHSFTGEDVVEIAFHGSPYILSRAIQQLSEAGCRPALAGEFTRRAFVRGKMDLTQAEAIADLIASESEASAKLAMQHVKGHFSSRVKAMRDQLIEFASLLELELDFSEEDVAFADRNQLKRLLSALQTQIEGLLGSYQMGNAIKHGIPVAIVGPPNAGKSTLLNALLEDERALVTEIPGTTRDTIEDDVIIEGLKFRFIDTAGLRETEDRVEQLGIERSHQSIQKAELVIRLADAQQETEAAVTAEVKTWAQNTGKSTEDFLVVWNKADLVPELMESKKLWLVAPKSLGLDQLKRALLQRIQDKGYEAGALYISQARHRDVLSKSLEGLQRVEEGLESGLTSDLVALDLRYVLHSLGELTGDISNEEVLGAIFSKFCIGK